jgi:hypothetical protein
MLAVALIPALAGVFMPFAWMRAAHAWLGMGDLPVMPVIDYLARSTSAFYALLGGLCWVLAGDPRRYRPPLLFLGLATVVYSLGVMAIDFIAGLPWWWTWGEGPLTAILGLVVWLLAVQLPATSAAPAAADRT